MSTTTLLLGHRYRLDQRIAAGGAGEVWRSTDTLLGRPVAVKLLRCECNPGEEILARFRAEARNAGSLSHPAIARIYDYCDDDPPHPPYLVMEFVDGPSLAGRLAEGPLDLAHAMDVLAQAAGGLSAAHAAGLVHRDIKPGNLLLGRDGKVRITDFGIARAVGSAPLTSTGTLLGTPTYLAPERVTGGSGTPAADLYSLGVVAYECLAGRPPFGGRPLDIAFAHRDRPPPPLPRWVPAEVAALIARLTAKDPAARPASAADLARRAAVLRDAAAGRSAPRLLLPPGTQPAPEEASRTTQSLPALAERSGPVTAGVPALPAAAARPAVQRRAREGWLAGSWVRTGDGWASSGSAAVHGRAWGRVWPRWVPKAAVAGVLMACALGWLLANVLGIAPAPRRAVVPTASPPTAPSTPMIDVDASAFTGQPIADVRAQLRRLGLVVRVRWQSSTDEPSGSVVSVRPTGRLPAGTQISLLATFRPPTGNRPAGNRPRTGNHAPAGTGKPPGHRHGHRYGRGHRSHPNQGPAPTGPASRVILTALNSPKPNS